MSEGRPTGLWPGGPRGARGEVIAGRDRPYKMDISTRSVTQPGRSLEQAIGARNALREPGQQAAPKELWAICAY